MPSEFRACALDAGDFSISKPCAMRSRSALQQHAIGVQVVNPELLTVRDVAAALRVSPRQIWKLNAMGRLPAPVRLARSVRWRSSDIAEFVRLGCPTRERFEAEIARAAK